MDGKVIFLWCHPRSISTAFERAFMQRQDVITFHEPFGDAFYFGPERISNYHSDEVCAQHEHANTTYGMIINELLTVAKTGKNVFVKDMGRHIIKADCKSDHSDNPTILPNDFLKRCYHTFLIRTPEKALPSMYRCFLSNQCAVYNRFLVEEIGFSELQILFEFLTKLNGTRHTMVYYISI